MPLNLFHLLWPSTMGENVCDWWCDTRSEFTLFLVSQKHIVLTMGTKLCRMFKDAWGYSDKKQWTLQKQRDGQKKKERP